MIVIPFEDTNPETVAPLEHFFEKCFDYLGMNLVGKVVVPGVTKKGEVLNHEKYLKEAFEIGKQLAR